jgi:hypothetical protein
MHIHDKVRVDLLELLMKLETARGQRSTGKMQRSGEGGHPIDVKQYRVAHYVRLVREQEVLVRSLDLS